MPRDVKIRRTALMVSMLMPILLTALQMLPSRVQALPVQAWQMPFERALASQPAVPPGKTAGKKIALLSIPGFSFRELDPSLLDRLPNLQWLSEHGGAGAMNIRTPIKGLEDSYLTFGSGAPSVSEVGIQSWQNGGGTNAPADSDSLPALQAYERFQNTDAKREAILVPEIEYIRSQNAQEAYGAVIGLLGETLKRHGIGLYVYGNADLGQVSSAYQTAIPGEPSRLNRYAPLVLMDSKGVVSHGMIDSRVLLRDPDGAFGVKTNQALLLKAWREAEAPSVVLFEWGDLYRLHMEKDAYRPEVFDQRRMEALRELDQFIGKLLHDVKAVRGSQDELWIFSPMVNPDAMQEKNMMSPLLHFRQGIGGGLLTSGTTRQPGLVANYDLAPTMLETFAVSKPAEMQGHPMFAEIRPDAFRQLLQSVEVIRRVYVIRLNLIYVLVIYEMLVLLSSLFIVFKNWNRKFRWLNIPLLSTLISPLVILWMGYGAGIRPEGLIGFFVLAMIILSVWASRLELFQALGIIGMTTGLWITVDGLAGSPGMKRSILGYDSMIGARYYGIGNEFMGIVIGALILGLTALLQRQALQNQSDSSASLSRASWASSSRLNSLWLHFPRIKWLTALLWSVVTSYMASPGGGTNAGGAITATIAFGIAWLRIFGGNLLKDIRWLRLTVVLFILFVSAGAGLFLFNMVFLSNPEQESHIGRAMHLLFAGRIDLIVMTVIRKLEMNLHLIGVSLWTKVLISSMAVMTVFVLKPWGVFRSWQTRFPAMMSGFSAIVIGSVVTLLVNDSGIVAASTMIVYAAVPMLLMKLQE